MILVIGILFVVSLLAIVSLSLMTQQSRMTEHTIDKFNAELAARAALISAYDGLRTGAVVKPTVGNPTIYDFTTTNGYTPQVIVLRMPDVLGVYSCPAGVANTEFCVFSNVVY